jgi:hypothetical protein
MLLSLSLTSVHWEAAKRKKKKTQQCRDFTKRGREPSANVVSHRGGKSSWFLGFWNESSNYIPEAVIAGKPCPGCLLLPVLWAILGSYVDGRKAGRWDQDYVCIHGSLSPQRTTVNGTFLRFFEKQMPSSCNNGYCMIFVQCSLSYVDCILRGREMAFLFDFRILCFLNLKTFSFPFSSIV